MDLKANEIYKIIEDAFGKCVYSVGVQLSALDFMQIE
jgi:hypothetical protein